VQKYYHAVGQGSKSTANPQYVEGGSSEEAQALVDQYMQKGYYGAITNAGPISNDDDDVERQQSGVFGWDASSHSTERGPHSGIASF
jgi:hypothetical protein